MEYFTKYLFEIILLHHIAIMALLEITLYDLAFDNS